MILLMRCAITGFYCGLIKIGKWQKGALQARPQPSSAASMSSGFPKCHDMRWPKVAGAGWGLLGHRGSISVPWEHLRTMEQLLCFCITDNRAKCWINPTFSPVSCFLGVPTLHCSVWSVALCAEGGNWGFVLPALLSALTLLFKQC